MFTLKKVRGDDLATSARNWNTRMGKRGRDIALATALYFKSQAQNNCPVLTGKLRNSIGNPQYGGIWDVSAGGLRITVGTKVPYAIPVERGVKQSYTISAKPGKVLAFKWKGRQVYVKSVTHPSFKGKFYMRKAAATTRNNKNIILSGIR